MWHDEVKEPDVSIQLAHDNLKEWISVRDQKTSSAVQHPITDTNQKPPVKGYVKCNVDAAIFYNQRHLVLECVFETLRDILLKR